jgi:hypothetical protein
VDGDQGVEPRARATTHEQLLVLERLQVRAGQLPVIVNTAIVPCPWGRDAAGILDGSIEPVEAAGTTLVLPPLAPVEPVGLVPVEELPVFVELLGVLVAELPSPVVWPVPVAVPELCVVPLAGAVPVDVGDDALEVGSTALGAAGVAVDGPSLLDVEDGGAKVTGALGSIRLGGVPGP